MTRTEKIKSRLSSDSEAFLITSDSNRFYASSFNSSAGFMLVCKERSELYLDSRYYEMAKIAKVKGKLQPDTEICLFEKKRREYLKEFCERYNIKTLLCEDKSLTVFEYKQLEEETKEFCEITGMDDILEKCRVSKDEEEILRIKSAQKITDMAFMHILDFITPDVTEIDIALELEYYMRRSGAESTAFETICVSGTKSSLPHGKSENIKIGKGFLTMDFGARYEGYCSDMTRTVCIGRPDDEMKRVYNTVLEAQKRAFDVITAGVTGKQVDATARDYIYSNGYKGCFGHSTGHSLGIDIHESPSFSPNCNTEIPASAVLSVEPGIYIEGKYGVRIEDIVKISEFGCENLTESAKELIIL